VIAVVDEAATKFAGLVSRELDLAGISPSMAHVAAEDPALRVVDYPVLVAYGIVFNTHRPPFDDVRVRRAVSLAIDRQRVIDAALAGFATPASGPVPPDHPFALQEPARVDTARASRLLDSGGWVRGDDGVRHRNGQPLTFELLTVGSADNAAEQLIQADLAAIGVRLEIRQREMGAFLAEAHAQEKRFDALFTGVPGDLSLGYLSSMFDSRLAGGVLDYGGFHTPRLDALLARARSAVTDSTSRQAWHDLQRELATQMPVAWVYHARGLQGMSRRLHGVRMDLRGELATVTQWRVDP
jgi:peptide/nickel transport system substrate-binding protein